MSLTDLISLSYLVGVHGGHLACVYRGLFMLDGAPVDKKWLA